MAHLIVKSGVDAGKSFELDHDVVSIGRNRDNNVVLTDSGVSRCHAWILRRKNRYFVRDLNSTHGTYVNEIRCDRESPLTENDIVRLGNTLLLFRLQTTRARVSTDGGGDFMRTLSVVPETPGDTIAITMPAAQRSTGALQRQGLSERQLRILTDAAESTQSLLDLDELLSALMDFIFRGFEIDRAAFLLFDGDDGPLRPQMIRPENAELKISQTIVERAIEDRELLQTVNAAEDSRFKLSESIFDHSISSAICAPLVARDRVLGALYVDTQSRKLRYENQEIALLNLLAAQAAMSIDNAQLVREKVDGERLAAIGMAISGISHYIKNVIAGVTSSSRLIQMAIDDRDFERVCDAWPILLRGNDKISSLVKDMLNYSKKREPELEDGSLNELLEDIHSEQSARATDEGVALELDLDSKIPVSRFDYNLLHDVALNIVGNAIEACSGRPDARVRLVSHYDVDGNLGRLDIDDNGPGIPDQFIQQIFEPFFSTKGSKGTGLGLAVARKAIEDHGGSIEVTSDPGKLTRFRVRLPLLAPDDFSTSQAF